MHIRKKKERTCSRATVYIPISVPMGASTRAPPRRPPWPCRRSRTSKLPQIQSLIFCEFPTRAAWGIKETEKETEARRDGERSREESVQPRSSDPEPTTESDERLPRGAVSSALLHQSAPHEKKNLRTRQTLTLLLLPPQSCGPRAVRERAPKVETGTEKKILQRSAKSEPFNPSNKKQKLAVLA